MPQVRRQSGVAVETAKATPLAIKPRSPSGRSKRLRHILQLFWSIKGLTRTDHPGNIVQQAGYIRHLRQLRLALGYDKEGVRNSDEEDSVSDSDSDGEQARAERLQADLIQEWQTDSEAHGQVCSHAVVGFRRCIDDT